MRNKKLFLPAVIISAAIAAMAVCAVIIGIAYKPTITEHTFPFSITYELDGKTETIAEIYEAYYDRNDGYADTKTRVYRGTISGSQEDDGTRYILREDSEGRIILLTKLYASYLMGDSKYDYFDDEPFEPQILYYDVQEEEYADEETLAAQGVRLIGWEYPTPIENTLVFSHISYMSGAVVLPMVVIALLALLVVVVFVKKDREPGKKWRSIVFVILNVVVFLWFVPILTVYGMFVDINGGSGEVLHQMSYLLSPITILGIAASVSLRRKGYDKTGCIVQFIGPVLLGIQLLLYSLF